MQTSSDSSPALFVIFIENNDRQRDIYFGVHSALEEAFPSLEKFWPDVPEIRVTSYMRVTHVGNHEVSASPLLPAEIGKNTLGMRLYRVNAANYRQGFFEGPHTGFLVAAVDETGAKALSRRDHFFDGVPIGTMDPVDIGKALEKQGWKLSLTKSPLVKELELINFCTVCVA